MKSQYLVIFSEVFFIYFIFWRVMHHTHFACLSLYCTRVANPLLSRLRKKKDFNPDQHGKIKKKRNWFGAKFSKQPQVKNLLKFYFTHIENSIFFILLREQVTKMPFLPCLFEPLFLPPKMLIFRIMFILSIYCWNWPTLSEDFNHQIHSRIEVFIIIRTPHRSNRSSSVPGRVGTRDRSEPAFVNV
jgi:hypothetical protein